MKQNLTTQFNKRIKNLSSVRNEDGSITIRDLFNTLFPDIGNNAYYKAMTQPGLTEDQKLEVASSYFNQKNTLPELKKAMETLEQYGLYANNYSMAVTLAAFGESPFESFPSSVAMQKVTPDSRLTSSDVADLTAKIYKYAAKLDAEKISQKMSRLLKPTKKR